MLWLVAAWAHDLEQNILADCTEWISAYSGQLSKIISDQVVILFFDLPCPIEQVLKRIMDEVIELCWKKFEYFTSKTCHFLNYTG